MDELISRKTAIKAIEELQDCYNGFSDTFDKACIIGVLEELPPAQTSLIEAVKIIEGFLHGCHDSLTSEIVTPDGIKLHTDWGYFEEGLEEIKRYAERRA